MKYLLYAYGIVFFLGVLLAFTSDANTQGLAGANIKFKDCYSMSYMSSYLEENNEEQLTFQGPSMDGGLTSLFMSTDGETWTMTYTFTTGETCVIDSGTNWEVRYDIKNSKSAPRI